HSLELPRISEIHSLDKQTYWDWRCFEKPCFYLYILLDTPTAAWVSFLFYHGHIQPEGKAFPEDPTRHHACTSVFRYVLPRCFGKGSQSQLLLSCCFSY